MLEENRVNDSEENNIFQFKRYTSLEFNQVWGCKKGNVQARKASKTPSPRYPFSARNWRVFYQDHQ